jgi:hypothetical protein
MKNKYLRKAFGLAQIMATLLVVLPTLAFIITFMLDYWAVMQADSRLKLITNLSSTALDSLEDLSDVGITAYGATSDWTDLSTKLNQLCPAGKTISIGAREDAPNNMVVVSASYNHVGRYFNKTISTSMSTYSYHDQNATINLVCQ